MRRCHFLGPHFCFFPALAARPFVVPPLHSFSLPSHLQIVGRGCLLVLALRALDGRLPGPRIQHCFHRAVGAGAGSAPRQERPRFCVGVCLGGDPTPAGGAGRDPRGGGASARAPPGEDFTAAAAAALVCSVTPPGPLHPSREGRAPRPRLPSSPPWPPSHPTPLFARFPAPSFSLVNSTLAGRLAKLRLKTKKRGKEIRCTRPGSPEFVKGRNHV